MPKMPGVSPLQVPTAVCPECSTIMTAKVVSASTGKLDHILLACHKCEYAFHHRPNHINGEFRQYKVFSEGVKHSAPPSLVEDSKVV